MSHDNVTEEGEAAQEYEDEFHNPDFWRIQIEEAESNPLRMDWLEAGERVQSLLSRRMDPAGKEKQHQKDPVDYTTSLAWAMIGELIYREPEPTCKSWRDSNEPIAPIWKRLEKYTLEGRTRLNQVNGLMFMAKGLAGVKILPAGPVPRMYRVAAENILFDKRFVKQGGEIFEDALFIIEKIDKRVCDVRRSRHYNKEMRDYVADWEVNVQKLPEELAITTVYEIHARRASGKWDVFTWHRQATKRLLQKGKEPIPTPPYAFLHQPGGYGLETGILARISELDESTNRVFKRGLSRSQERSDVLVIDGTKVKPGNTSLGKGNKSSAVQRAFKAGKSGIAQLEVTGKPSDVVSHEVVGQMEREDMIELDFQRGNMQWQLGASPQGLSGEGSGEKTATEVDFIESMRRQRASVVELLVDSYYDRMAYVMALWLKWMVDHSGSSPKYLDLFTHAIPDEEQYSMFMAMVPGMSRTLSEFRFGIEKGSTRQMRNRFMIEAFDRLLQMAPQLQTVAEMSGQRLVLEPLLAPFFKALDLPINTEKLLQPAVMQPNIDTEGEEIGDNEQPVGDTEGEAARILAALTGQGGGGQLQVG